MRCLRDVAVLLALMAAPLGVSAQAGDETEHWEPKLQDSAPCPEPQGEQPALKLELDDAGVGVLADTPQTPDGHTLERMRRRVRNMEVGLGISILSVLVGGVFLAVSLDEGIFPDDPNAGSSRDDRIGIAGATLAIGGVVSLLTTAILLRNRKQELREAEHTHSPTPSRGQWDLARSRLVF